MALLSRDQPTIASMAGQPKESIVSNLQQFTINCYDELYRGEILRIIQNLVL